jgi:hypothetical protein
MQDHGAVQPVGVRQIEGQVARRDVAADPLLGCSLEEAGELLFTFTHLPSNQWRSAGTSNAVQRLHDEFKRRIRAQTVLPSPEIAAVPFWALLASAQITMREVYGWQTLATKPTEPVCVGAFVPAARPKRLLSVLPACYPRAFRCLSPWGRWRLSG